MLLYAKTTTVVSRRQIWQGLVYTPGWRGSILSKVAAALQGEQSLALALGLGRVRALHPPLPFLHPASQTPHSEQSWSAYRFVQSATDRHYSVWKPSDEDPLNQSN